MTNENQENVNSRELDAVIAERVMGWEWLERDTHSIPRKALYAPLDWGWIRWNFSDLEYRPARPETERFGDWDNCCSSDDRTMRGLPHYSTEIAAAMAVVEAIDAARFRLTRYSGSDEDAVTWSADFEGNGIAVGFTAAEAICRAALQATASASAPAQQDP